MENTLFITGSLSIPLHEVEISASRSGGPGGQHVNKTSSKITARWNVRTSAALSEEQRQRIIEKLDQRLTQEGDLIVHNSTSRSQHQNRAEALKQLAKILQKALHIPKKRMKTVISAAAQEARKREKQHRSDIKRQRSRRHDTD